MTESWALEKVPLVVSAGEVLWDVHPSTRTPGGAPANCAVYAAGLDVRAALVSRVGDDPLGRKLVGVLRGYGVDVAQVRTDGVHPTGSVTVTTDATGRPQYHIDPDSAWDFIEYSTALHTLAGEADAVCFGTLSQRSSRSRASIRRLVGDSSPGALRMCDVNLRQPYVTRKIVHESLEMATMVKLNETELEEIRAWESLDAMEAHALESLRARYDLDLVALTRGDRGSRLVTRDDHVEHEGVSVEVVDTVGAGDAFTAALIVGWLQKLPLLALSEFANQVASAVCEHQGALPARG